MKKIITAFAALLFVASASATEVIREYDFEGEFTPWKVWNNRQENKILDANMAKDSKRAIEVRDGSFFDYHAPKAKATYILTADVKHMWGSNIPKIVAAGYDPEVQKLVDLKVVEVSMDKNYQKVTLKFKTKYPGYHRITFIPGGCIAVDNVKLVAQ
ncbi:MAG: hypothetical protein SNH13_05735 [Rikenellaceae bacterium]